MATIEQLEKRMPFREHGLGVSESYLRRPLMPSIRWGSVIAGVAFGMSVQLVLALLGLAIGLTTIEAEAGDPVGMGALFWASVSMLSASFAGGFVAARMSGLRRKTDGLLHGAVSWAVSTLMFATLASVAGGVLLGGVFNSMATETAREAKTEDYGLTTLLRGMIGGDASVSDVKTLQRYIRSGQREEATLLLSSMGMDPIQAATVVDQAMIAAGNPQRTFAQGIDAADRQVRSAGGSTWAVFGGVFLSLLLGMAGGVVGAKGSQRMVWNKGTTVGTGKDADTVPS